MKGSTIAKAVFKFFENEIPCKGKPKVNQWTVLSAFLIEDDNDLSVVAIGTGTRCLGETEKSSKGDLVHDSHAEVLARRAFRRYLVSQIKICSKDKDPKCIFKKEYDYFHLKKSIKIHFFTSLAPCGDACIRPNPAKKIKLDIHRTGAKCVSEEQFSLDRLGSGREYHVLGAIRTKPGRGTPSLSRSCSDKMLKWNVCGLEGRLLKKYFISSPVKWTSITINGIDWSEEAVRRALFERTSEEVCQQILPKLFGSTERFQYDVTTDNKNNPSADSIVWSAGSVVEVLSKGRKSGVIKKHFGSEKSRVKICRLEYAREVLELLPNSIKLTFPMKYSEFKKLPEEPKLKKYMPQLWSNKSKALDNFDIHIAIN